GRGRSLGADQSRLRPAAGCRRHRRRGAQRRRGSGYCAADPARTEGTVEMKRAPGLPGSRQKRSAPGLPGPRQQYSAGTEGTLEMKARARAPKLSKQDLTRQDLELIEAARQAIIARYKND